jgi:Flagellar motor protein
MNLLRGIIYVLFALSLGLSFYLWFYEIPKLKKVIYDLNEENLNLLKNFRENPEKTDTFTLINILSDDLFDPGSAELSEKGKKKLDEILESYRGKFREIEVSAYTDKSPVQTNRDKYPTNWELASARASAIVRYFISKGVEPSKLSAKSYGDSRAKGKPDDRRVEIRIY